MQALIDVFLHLDVHLAELAANLGPWLYLVLFLIVFAETGLVVTPILPGDSLLFAVGALSAVEGSGMNVHVVAPMLLAAALTGDNVNYWIGRFIGPKIFTSGSSRFLNKK